MRREHLSSAMLRNRCSCWLALLIALPFAISVWAQETNRELSGTALKDALLRGGYVLYFRHAATDFGQNDDRMSGYEDCAQQRNLTDSGRNDARAIGAEVRRLHIPVNTVLASPFCRTRETAQLIFGHATVDARVRGGPARPDDPEQTARQLKRDRRLSGKPFIAHTAADEPLVRRIAAEIGFRRMVVKGGESLTEMLEALLEIPEERRFDR